MKAKVLVLAIVGMGLISGCVVTHKRGANVDAVIDVYRQHRAENEACYRRGLQEDPALNGTVTLAWRVDQSGKAKNARILSSSVANATMENCLLDNLSAISFPPQNQFSPAVVEYDLEFVRR